LAIAEEDEFLAEKLGFDRLRALHLIGETHGPPIAAEQLTARRAAADARKPLVIFLGQHLRPPQLRVFLVTIGPVPSTSDAAIQQVIEIL
jgi:hypothetical protein